MIVPQLILKQLYTNGSLKNTDSGVSFSLKNRLADARLLSVKEIHIDDTKVDVSGVTISLDDNTKFSVDEVKKKSIDFPLRRVLHISIPEVRLSEEKHQIKIQFKAEPFGSLTLKVTDAIAGDTTHITRIPRNGEDDYSKDIISKRQKFIEKYAGKVSAIYLNTPLIRSSCREILKSFTGVVQVPLGFAGPILIDGEHASGEFIVPLATSEGTLVASYNRGIKVINLSGGAKVTVVADAMQRAPGFCF
jgi:hydroxymethylglutaryl-CoA reductase (NADPH)